MNRWIVTLGALTLAFVLWEFSLWGLNLDPVEADQRSDIAPLKSEAHLGHKHSKSEVGHQKDDSYMDDHAGHDHAGHSHESEREKDLKETN